VSGFLCVLNTDGTPVDGSLLQRMTGAMSRRGPDGLHTWHEGTVGLGFALLRSTFEAARERQPISFDGHVWISADARIDGRKELIDRLNARGRTVSGDAPDVELLLHAYYVWGEGCLEQVIGDFAFAIWDARQARLFCAHDHFGVVPVYYAATQDCVLVGNTVACLQRHPAVSGRLNEQAIGDFLLTGQNYDLTTTTFADIRRLAPAEKLTWSPDGLRVARYWSLPEERRYLRYRRSAEYGEHFRAIFEQAVADRLRTDAVATNLSGGLDSSSITVTAARVLRQTGRPFDLRAYNVMFERLIPDDEGPLADEIAALGGFPVIHFRAEDYLEARPLDRPAYVGPEPGAPAGTAVEEAVAREAAGFSRVLLVGFGGDPLFIFDPLYARRMLRAGRIGALGADMGRFVALYHRRPPLGLRSLLIRRRGVRGSAPSLPLPAWVNREFAARAHLEDRFTWIQTRSYDRGPSEMITEPLWTHLFALADPGATGLALRVRFPFFDLRLVRLVQQVPHLPWRFQKTLLRQAMRGALPDRVLRRPKTPLRSHPYFELYRQQGIPPWLADLLAEPALAPYVESTAIGEMLAAPENLTVPRSYELLHLTHAAYWLRQQGRVAASA
jgi:asparagine synthase (glutamine-hydrolysing)